MFQFLPPQLVEKPWGQTGLQSKFGARIQRLGEVWFDRIQDPLPILCKWLFTSEKLSIQVHPNDEQASARGHPTGKDECWIVVEADPGAALGLGLTKRISPSELRRASKSGELEQLLDWKPVKPGDWFYIPAGTIHAIGAGLKLIEIQQNSSITYRLFDYGRPRELHLDDGVAVAAPQEYLGEHGTMDWKGGTDRFLRGPYFSLTSISGDAFAGRFSEESLLVPVRGSYLVDGERLSVGQVGYGIPRSIQSEQADSVILIAEQTFE